MANRETDAEDLVVRIPASLLNPKRTGELAAQGAQHPVCSFEKCGIIPYRVKRTSEHGVTEAASLGFGEHARRHRVLALLDTPFLYSRIQKLLDYVCSLGLAGNSQQRYYAACAVSELVSTQPFLELKDAIILAWASNENPDVRGAAGIALGRIGKQERHRSEVLLLLRHWLSNSNLLLVDTALAASFWLAATCPAEVLESIRALVIAGHHQFYPEVIDLFGEVSCASLHCAIHHLHRWLFPMSNPDLACMAALLFLIHVRLDDWAKDEQDRQKIVEIIFDLWENASLPLHHYLQEQTTAKVESWAKEIIRVGNREESAVVPGYREFFHELFRKYNGRPRNRLQFHLDRWQRRREREDAQIGRRQKASSEDRQSQQLCFRDLAPKERP